MFLAKGTTTTGRQQEEEWAARRAEREDEEMSFGKGKSDALSPVSPVALAVCSIAAWLVVLFLGRETTTRRRRRGRGRELHICKLQPVILGSCSEGLVKESEAKQASEATPSKQTTKAWLASHAQL